MIRALSWKKKTTYFTLVRPIVTFFSTVWDPQTQANAEIRNGTMEGRQMSKQTSKHLVYMIGSARQVRCHVVYVV